MISCGLPPRREAPLNAPSAQLRRLQARVFALTWLTYAAYYLCRKNFAVTKTDNLLYLIPQDGYVTTLAGTAYDTEPSGLNPVPAANATVLLTPDPYVPPDQIDMFAADHIEVQTDGNGNYTIPGVLAGRSYTLIRVGGPDIYRETPRHFSLGPSGLSETTEAPVILSRPRSDDHENFYGEVYLDSDGSGTLIDPLNGFGHFGDSKVDMRKRRVGGVLVEMTDEHGFVLATATTDAHGVFAFGWTTSPPVYFSPAETYFLRLPSQTLPGTAPVSPIMVQFVALSRNDIPLAP